MKNRETRVLVWLLVLLVVLSTGTIVTMLSFLCI